MLRITFDTNALGRVAQPELYAKDARQPDFWKVHQALKDGRCQGFFCETLITLEGIQKKDRATVFHSTRTKTHRDEDGDTIRLRLVVDQPARQPLPPKASARVSAAIALGMKVLRAPRIGMLRLEDPEEKYFPVETEAELGARIGRYENVLGKIEARGVGVSRVRCLGQKFAMRDGINEPWFRSLVRAKDVHEENDVKRAVAEWADADSVAAHVGYGLDLFCTEDAGKGAGAPSIFDANNRNWLKVHHGVIFVTISELIERL